ncbi:MAG: hypothetical protein EA389_06370 [Ilumatobacter sp.]|nr:MAG: hypothetical protein EA389_06370 [Ilumatobacter sp.]
MTASADRRRRRTLTAAVLAVVATLLVVVITAVGATSLANSQAGRDASQGRLVQVRVPATPTALVAVVDDVGRLTSMAVLVLDPSGVGGSIVSIPATADSTLDLGDDRYPVAETLEVQGVEAFVLEAEAMTALSFDVVELTTAERLADLVGRLGTVDVELPVDVVDDRASAPVAVAGQVTLTPDEVAAVLTASTEFEPAHVSEPAREAVWAAIASRVGAGTGSAEPVPSGVDTPTPADLDEFVDRLFAGRVGARSLTFAVPPDERNPRDVDVVVLDRAEVLLVFAQIAPGRVAAPNESLTFRIEAVFSEADLANAGFNNADAARDVINRLLFVQANVVSVVTGGDRAPEVSRAYVSDASMLDQVEEGWSVLLGEVEVEAADFEIPGVDAVIVLGRSYLDLRRDEAATGSSVPGGLTEPTELGPTDDEPDDEPDE